MRTTIGLALATLLLAGCGGGGDEYDDIEAVAEAIGCEPEARDTMMFAAESATCELDGEELTINWFNNNDARDQYVDMGTSNGAVYVTGDNWNVEAGTRDLQTQVAEDTGGEKAG